MLVADVEDDVVLELALVDDKEEVVELVIEWEEVAVVFAEEVVARGLSSAR